MHLAKTNSVGYNIAECFKNQYSYVKNLKGTFNGDTVIEGLQRLFCMIYAKSNAYFLCCI